MIAQTVTSLPETPRGWILYDGRCGLCTAGARRLMRWLGSLGYRLAPLQAPWVRQRFGTQALDVPREMLLLTPAGRILGGADAFIQICEDFTGNLLLARVLRSAPISRILRGAYQFLASRRHQISEACRLKPMTEDEILQNK